MCCEIFSVSNRGCFVIEKVFKKFNQIAFGLWVGFYGFREFIKVSDRDFFFD